MKRLVLSVLAAAALALGAFAGGARADKPPAIPAFHDDELVTFTVVNENVEGKNRPADGVPIPLYAFGPPGAQPQFDVLSAVPGMAGYHPWWRVIIVVILDGRDVSVDPFTSDEEILAAATEGDVALIDIDFVFLCQVLPGANAPG